MKVSHRIVNGQHETIIQLHWYAQAGNYLVEAVGLGNSPEAAETSARLLLGQARAQLNTISAEEVA